MQRKLLTIIFIIIFVLGAAFLGYVLGYNQVQPQAGLGPFEIVNSKLLVRVSVSFYGKISAISDKNLTIEDNGNNLTLDLPENVFVNEQPSFSVEEENPPLPKQLKLEGLKVGDTVSVNLMLGKDGKAITLNIMLFPEPSPAPTE